VSSRAALIKQVALDLFTANGYEQTRVDDIAAALGMSRRTFFRYFNSKEDIVFSWTDDEALTAWPLLLECAKCEEPMSALRRAFLRLASRREADLTQVRRLMTIIMRTPSLRGRLYNESAAWQAKLGEALQVSYPNDPGAILGMRVRSAAAVAAYLTAVEAWIAAKPEQRLDSLVGAAFDALIYGSVAGEQHGYSLRLESDQSAASGTDFHRWQLDRALLGTATHIGESNHGATDHHGGGGS
jgi:AcrR family transcriptional regulator